jgi:alpha-tubulin suppressor-like RCC1 family protein
MYHSILNTFLKYVLFAFTLMVTGCFFSAKIDVLGVSSEQEQITDKSPVNTNLFIELENPPADGTTILSHSVNVISSSATSYIYKYGSANDINCESLDGYSTVTSISAPLQIVVSSFNGDFALCVLGVSSIGETQPPSKAVIHIWRQSWKPFIYIEKPGQALALTTSANLNIHAPSEWTEVYITQDSSCTTGGSWQSNTALIPVTLVPDPSTKNATTYAIFRNASGSLSECVSDTIKVASTVTVSSCSGALSTDSPIGEFIDSGGTASDYMNDESCSITITGGPKVFTFETFQTEEDYDFVTIYKDSTSSSANILIDTSGSVIPTPVTSSSNTNIIQFSSDSSVTEPGYKITWTSPSITGTNSLKISGDANSSSTRTVPLDILHIGQFTEMYITNDSSCSVSGTWEPVANSKNWELATGNGIKTVYIKFRDPSGRESNCESDSIILYEGSPAMAILSGTPADNDGSDYLNITVGGTDISAYKFKIGVSASLNCSDPAGYSTDKDIADPINSNLLAYGSVSLKVCVLGINPIGVSQSLLTPTSHTWFRNVPLMVQFDSSGELIAEGATSVSFKVVANGVALMPVIVDYDIYGDFVSSQGFTSGQVTILAGQTEATITLPITANPVQTVDRRISVGISDLTTPHRLGLISTASKLVIDAQRPVSGVLDIGNRTGCAILTDGKLVCRDSVGGDRESTNRFVEGFQQLVSTKTFSSIVTDQAHKCALTTGGELYCWGWGFDGQLGLGNQTDQVYPQLVPGLTWKKVVSSHSWNNVCGIDSNDDLYCWGDQTFSYGAAGNGTTNDSLSPTNIDVANKYKQIVISGNSVCGITLTTNILKCWGRNFNSILGDGSTTDRFAPVVIDSGTEYNDINFGQNYTQGLTSTGAWKFWGYKIFSSSYEIISTPQLIDSSRVYTALTGTANLACGLSNGDLYCIGNDYDNLMGFGNVISTPTLIDSVDKYTQIKSSANFICGITIGNQLKCFGSGLSSSESTTAIAFVPKLPTVWDSSSYSKLIPVNNGMCGITTTGFPKCIFKGTSANNSYEYRETWVPRLIESTINIRYASNRYILDENNKLYKWGANTEGDYSFTRRTNPLRTLKDHSISILSEGSGLNCFINTSNKVFCWGNNPGDGSQTAAIPVAVDSSTNYSSIDVGTDFACGITSTNILKCWGKNADGQLGLNDTTDRLTPVTIGSDYAKVSVWGTHSCALKTNNELYCWGKHTVSLGTGATQSLIPLRINSGELFNDIVTGHTNCAIRNDNSRVMCWGSSPSIGDGAASDRTLPTLTTDSSAYQKLFVNSNNYNAICGITGTTLKCWGNYKWPRTYSPTTVYSGTFKNLYIGNTNYLIDNNGHINYFNYSDNPVFGQQSHPKFEPLMGLVDRTPPIAP